MKELAKKLYSLGYYVDTHGEILQMTRANKEPIDRRTIDNTPLARYIQTQEHTKRLEKMKPFNVKR
jgi:hypothetical protein